MKYLTILSIPLLFSCGKNTQTPPAKQKIAVTYKVIIGQSCEYAIGINIPDSAQRIDSVFTPQTWERTVLVDSGFEARVYVSYVQKGIYKSPPLSVASQSVTFDSTSYIKDIYGVAYFFCKKVIK